MERTNRSANKSTFAPIDKHGAPHPASIAFGHFVKTKLCRYNQRGGCRNGSRCPFAHGWEELEDITDLRKTSLCPDFMAGGCRLPACFCPFAHGHDELRTVLPKRGGCWEAAAGGEKASGRIHGKLSAGGAGGLSPKGLRCGGGLQGRALRAASAGGDGARAAARGPAALTELGGAAQSREREPTEPEPTEREPADREPTEYGLTEHEPRTFERTEYEHMKREPTTYELTTPEPTKYERTKDELMKYRPTDEPTPTTCGPRTASRSVSPQSTEYEQKWYSEEEGDLGASEASPQSTEYEQKWYSEEEDDDEEEHMDEGESGAVMSAAGAVMSATDVPSNVNKQTTNSITHGGMNTPGFASCNLDHGTGSGKPDQDLAEGHWFGTSCAVAATFESGTGAAPQQWEQCDVPLKQPQCADVREPSPLAAQAAVAHAVQQVTVCVGQQFLPAFLWQGRLFVGNAEDVLKQAEPYFYHD